MEKNFCILTGEENHLNGGQTKVQTLPTNEVAQKIHHEIKGKPCFLTECGISIVEVKIGKKFDNNYQKQTPEMIKKVIKPMREEILVTTGLIPNTFHNVLLGDFVSYDYSSHGIFLYTKKRLSPLFRLKIFDIIM